MLIVNIEVQRFGGRCVYTLPLHPRYGPEPDRAAALLQYALLTWKQPVVVTPSGEEVALGPGRVSAFAVWQAELG